MTNTVALDVDQVLADFDGHWRQCAEQVLGREIPRVSGHFRLCDRYRLTARETGAVWRAYHADEWGRAPLYLHAADLVLALEDLGCTVWAVTSIDAKHLAARAAGLAGLIPSGRIVCVGDAAPASAKAEVLQDLGAVAFLDDHPANANAAIGAVNLPVLLDHGYEGLEAPEYGVTVVDDAMDFPVLVEEMLRRTGRLRHHAQQPSKGPHHGMGMSVMGFLPKMGMVPCVVEKGPTGDSAGD